MNGRDRERAGLIIKREAKLSRKELATQIDGIMRRNAAVGRLQSGNTYHSTLAIIAESAGTLVDNLSSKLLVIHSSPELYADLKATVLSFLEDAERDFTRDTTRRIGAMVADDKLRKMFSSIKDDIEAKLAIIGFEFDPTSSPQPEPKALTRTAGGRPRANFWDDLWANMAADLYGGQLMPKSQADIERAMSDWISEHGHTAASSTVRTRAQLLWKAISSA